MDIWSEGIIGGLRVPSRLVQTATGEGMCTERGEATPRLVERYRTLGRGGAIGLIVTGHAYVSPEGMARPAQIAADSDRCLPGLAQVSRGAREDGSRIFLQLSHSGLMASPELTGREALGPSVAEGETGKRAMTVDEIRALPNLFAAAALRAREAGFDGVQIHAAHGFLLNQFLSPYFNHREDEYGGDQEKRTRLVLEVIRAIREACGAGFVVAAKVNASDYLEGGLTSEQSLLSVQCMEKAGLDVVEVSGGSCANPDAAQGPMRPVNPVTLKGARYFAEHARMFREALGIPVVTVGGFRSLEAAQSALAEGTADFVGLCRPLIRRPDLVLRWKKGETEASDCLSCNRCLAISRSTAGVHCPLKI